MKVSKVMSTAGLTIDWNFLDQLNAVSCRIYNYVMDERFFLRRKGSKSLHEAGQLERIKN